MSVEVMTAVFRQSDARMADRLVLLKIADVADDDGFCWPSMRTIHEGAKVGRSTAYRCIDALVASGELRVWRRQDRSAAYLVTIAPRALRSDIEISTRLADVPGGGDWTEHTPEPVPERDTPLDTSSIADRPHPSQVADQGLRTFQERENDPSAANTTPVPERDTPSRSGTGQPVPTGDTPVPLVGHPRPASGTHNHHLPIIEHIPSPPPPHSNGQRPGLGGGGEERSAAAGAKVLETLIERADAFDAVYRWCNLTRQVVTDYVLDRYVPQAEAFITAGGNPTDEFLRRAAGQGIREPKLWATVRGAVPPDLFTPDDCDTCQLRGMVGVTDDGRLVAVDDLEADQVAPCPNCHAGATR